MEEDRSGPAPGPAEAGDGEAPAGLSPLMTARECARVLRLSERQIAKMCERGDLPAVKIGKLWRINGRRLAEKYGI